MNIVSFYAPRPEHPFFQDYRPYLALLRESCARFGHQHLVLTDDPMEIGADDAYVVDLPRPLMKAVLAAQYAYLADPANAHEPTLLVGADCVLANDPAAYFPTDCDLAVTVGDFADCRMNTGAIFVPHPCQVAEIWADALAHVGEDWGDDQTSLYRAIQERPTHGLWSADVRELPVDPFNLAPEFPGDDCRRGVVLHFRGPRKRWMQSYCQSWLGIGPGVTLNAVPNTSEADMAANVDACMERGLRDIGLRNAHEQHAVLVGGGASLESSLHEIKWRAAQGQTIFALNGTAKWLADRGIVADYAVILDPRASNAGFIDPRVGTWLLASQCAPEVFDAAESQRIRPLVWHFLESAKHIPDAQLVGGGITVGLTAMALAYTMGYRMLHLYGYDSSMADDGSAHAYAQAESAPDAQRLEVWSGRNRFLTSPAMYAQARAFPEWAAKLANEGAVITVHGTGLLPTVARQIDAAIPLQGELAA
jgi:hypothetical protein